MIRFLADADFSGKIVGGCVRREPSIDFLSAHRAGLARVPDPQVLAIAAEQDRILVTHDRHTMPGHFGDFLAAGGTSPGVFVVSQDAPITEVIEALVLVWAATDPEEWRDRIVQLPL